MDKPLPREPFDEVERASLETVHVATGRGEAEAQFELGLEFANAGDRQNDEEAARHYLKAAAQNHVRAQIKLSVMYSRGQGVRRDETQCLMWLSKAAHLGDAEAQYTLGMRQNRISMDQETQAGGELRIEAYKWVRLAAAQAYPEAEAGCDFVAMGMTRKGVTEGNRRAAAFAATAQAS